MAEIRQRIHWSNKIKLEVQKKIRKLIGDGVPPHTATKQVAKQCGMPVSTAHYCYKYGTDTTARYAHFGTDVKGNKLKKEAVELIPVPSNDPGRDPIPVHSAILTTDRWIVSGKKAPGEYEVYGCLNKEAAVRAAHDMAETGSTEVRVWAEKEVKIVEKIVETKNYFVTIEE